MPTHRHSPRRYFSAAVAPLPSSRGRIALAAALALAAAGCGGSSKPALTKAQFLTKANALCAAGEKKLESAGNALGSHPSQAQISALATGTFIPNIQSDIDDVRALGAQTGEQATITKMLDLGQADLNRIKANPALIASGPAAFADFAKVAHAYGLTQCARSS
jgi:hypothetical protein